MSEHTIQLQAVKNTKTGEMRVSLPHAQAFSTNIANGNPPQQPSTATGDESTQVPIPREDTDGYRWAPWGERDCLPSDVRCKIMQAPMASSAVYKLTKMMYGNGLAYVRNSELMAAADEKRPASRAYIPEVEQWLKNNRSLTKHLMPQMLDFRSLVNCFSEFVLNRRGDQITNLYHKPAEFCRLSKQNESTLDIEWLYYSNYFGNHTPSNDRIKKIHLLPWFGTFDYIDQRIKRNVRKFAWHSRLETPGIKYYARAPWLGLFRENGWIDNSIAVPEILNSMMRNQIVIMYQINIPLSYFTIRHQDWNTYDDDKRNAIIDAFITKINTSLSDTKDLYKSIATIYQEDDTNHNPIGKIEIIAIDEKVKKDAWIPTSDTVDAQVVQGFGLHPSQLGLGTKNGGMGAGSGSDQREGYNTEITINTLEQDIVLEPYNFAARFNARTNSNWDITFFIDHTHHTTTNNQESGLQPSATTTVIE